MDQDLPFLTVAFSTRGARSLGIVPALLPLRSGVDYLVLVQEAEADPRTAPHLAALAAAREDVEVHGLASRGVAASRNAAIDRARGEVLLFADDDVERPPGAFDAVRRFFAENPDQSLFVGQSLNPDGSPHTAPFPLPRPLGIWNSGRAATHALAVRVQAVRWVGVRFDESFGAGTAQFIGDEYIFLTDAMRAGLRGSHSPMPVSCHPFQSSGLIWGGAEAARARAAVFTRIFGRAAFPVRLGFALTRMRRFERPVDIWHFVRG